MGCDCSGEPAWDFYMDFERNCLREDGPNPNPNPQPVSPLEPVTCTPYAHSAVPDKVLPKPASNPKQAPKSAAQPSPWISDF